MPSKSLIHLAVDLGMQYSITVYDALYLSLAKIYDAKLITADKKLVNSLKKTEERDFFEWLGSVEI